MEKYGKRTAIYFVVIIALFALISLFYIFSSSISMQRHKNNVEPIITMIDLGYDNSVTSESLIDIIKKGSEIFGSYYYLSIYSEKENNTLHLILEIYDFIQDQADSQYMKEIIENKYTSIKKTESNCLSDRCKFPTVKYEHAVNNMVSLDPITWNALEVYSMHEINSSDSKDKTINTIFILQSNKMIIMQLNDCIELSEDKIQVITKSFEKTNYYFDESEDKK